MAGVKAAGAKAAGANGKNGIADGSGNGKTGTGGTQNNIKPDPDVAGSRSVFKTGGKGFSGADDAVNVQLSKSKYPESTKHIEDAIKGGQPDTLTINRGGAKDNNNRKASLKGIDKVPGADLGEYPPVMFGEGGKGASIRPINPSDSRGAGSTIGHQLREYPDGTKLN